MVRTLALIVAASLLAFWVVRAARAAQSDHPTPAPAAAFDRAPDRSPDRSADRSPDRAAAPAGRAEKAEAGHQFHGLLAASEIEVKTRLGAPDIARTEGSGAMWTYRLPDCALFVFFKGPQGQPLKMSGATAGPRVRGRSPPPVNDCVAEALDRQNALGRANP